MSLIFTPGRLYHVYSRPHTAHQCTQRDTFFKSYLPAIEPVAETLAYCLLPDHLHLVVRIRPLRDQITHWFGDGADMADFVPRDPAEQFTQLTRFYPDLHAIEIQSRSDLALLIRYIHQNPTLHDLTENFRHYAWSSYRTLINTQETRLQRDTVLALFYGVDWFEELHWDGVEPSQIGYLIVDD